MCNCNQKRANFSSNNSMAQKGTRKVKLVENDPVTMYGDITGRMYVFTNINDINWVDERDVASMYTMKNLLVLS